MNWRKSRRSFANGGCVEVANDWRKSSRSVGHDSGNCVEVSAPGAVLVRDTTDRQGVTLAVSPGAWAAFTAGLKGADL